MDRWCDEDGDDGDDVMDRWCDGNGDDVKR